MVSEMTPVEMDGWLAYHRLEPFGAEWYRNAILCATVVNANGASKKPMLPDDFMPEAPTKEPEINPEQAGKDFLAARFGK